MPNLNIITLLFNGLTLALALGFLIIVLWHDARKELNQFFAAFLFLVTLWNVGSLGALGISLIDVRSPWIVLPVSAMELGFTGASVAVYALVAVLTGIHTKRFRVLAFASLILILAYQIFLIVNKTPIEFALNAGSNYRYRFQPLSTLFYIIFDGVALYLLWRYRRKIRSFSLFWGLNLFVWGQFLGFLNPSLEITSASINVSSFAALVVSFSILRQDIITPLGERVNQLEAVYKLSLAITSQLSIDNVLSQIVTQAVGWLNADAAGIFLMEERQLRLATVYNLPTSYTNSIVRLGQGVAGIVAQTRQSIYLENYVRDWRGIADLPLSEKTFGSVISVPLVYGNDSIGVLMVIAGRQGRLFRREDVRPLELLGAQAAVAITHSHLFDKQEKLARQVEAARSQLETVLVSTENPVIAVDRKLKLIFANPAAHKLFPLIADHENQPLTAFLPVNVLPDHFRDTLHQLRRKGSYIYEISLRGQVYLCHVAQLGRLRPAGWVAVLNDVTQLKELDRLKSEMVRMTSHDLKNPLQAAMANLELLEEDLAGFDSAEVQISIQAIHKQLIRMNRIIGGILDLERLKSGTLAMALCEPRQIVDVTFDEMQHLAQEKQINFQTIIPENLPCFLADSGQFERALTNLVENAIKFTPSGGQVIIRVRSSDGNIIFEVEDNGIGVPPALQLQVFERFVRGAQIGQKGADHISGSGLGLSIVKTIVESHQGQVWLKSEEGSGTTFFVSVPVAVIS